MILIKSTWFTGVIQSAGSDLETLYRLGLGYLKDTEIGIAGSPLDFFSMMTADFVDGVLLFDFIIS